jgi:hypothetical protein
MTNPEQTANETPKTSTPSEAKPAPQQNQGDGKPSTEKSPQQK